MRLRFTLVTLFLFVLIPSMAFASEATTLEQDLKKDFDEAVNYLDNGTLYNYSIHHRRPAKAISEKPENRKYKSFAENLSYSVTSDFLSKYVYEGVASSRGWVWQPSATIEAYGVGFNAWGNFVMGNIADQGKFNEVDLTLYYDYKYKGLDIHPFFLACIYPTSNKVSLDYSANTDLKPSLHLAYTLGPVDIYTDVQLYVHPNPGSVIVDMGLGFQHQIAKRVGIVTSAQISFGNSKYNRSQFTINQNKFQDFVYQLGVNINAIKGLVIEPNVNIAAFFSQEMRNAVVYPVLVWGGVDFTYNF